MRRFFSSGLTVGLVLLAVAAVSAMSADSARADTVFIASLDGAQEVPPVATAGTGSATVVLNDAEDMALVSLSFSNLTSPQGDAHIHGPAAPGVDGPVVFGLPLGSFNDLPWALTPVDVANLKAGLLYVNVHTDLHPGGEIRGQLIGFVGGIAEFPAGAGAAPVSESASDSGSFPYAAVAAAVALGGAALTLGWWRAVARWR